MDVSCPACAARYKADEQKLRGKTAKMRCRACNTVWLVSGPEGATAEVHPTKRAAVVKRGAERENRDLFAISSRSADFGSVKETLRPPPPDATGSVAARNESSVLFTVDALKGAARVKTPEPELAPMSTSFQTDDDEGVIDLNALASGSGRPGARHVPVLFASEPPPGAFAADVDSGAHAAQGRSGFGKRAFIGMAAAAVALVLCTVGVAVAFRGEEPAPRAAAAAAPAPPAPAPVVTAATPPAAPEAATPATSSSDDDKSSKKKANFSKKRLQSGGATAAKSSKASSSEAAKPAATPKAADKCGCKGDFNCILRCTAKGS